MCDEEGRGQRKLITDRDWPLHPQRGTRALPVLLHAHPGGIIGCANFVCVFVCVCVCLTLPVPCGAVYLQSVCLSLCVVQYLVHDRSNESGVVEDQPCVSE